MQEGTSLLGGRGAGDGLTWMTRIVHFITVSVSTLFAIACSLMHRQPLRRLYLYKLQSRRLARGFFETII